MTEKEKTKSKSKKSVSKKSGTTKSNAKKSVSKKSISKKKEDEKIALLQKRLSALEEETTSIKRELLGDRITDLRLPDGAGDFVSFSLGKYDAALPLYAVNNVYRMVAIDQSVAHPGVLGMINIGGEPVLIIDLYDIFDLQLSDLRPEHFIVTFKARSSVFGFVTTSVYDVVTIAEEEYLRPEQVGVDKEIVIGGYKRDNLTLILDPERLAGGDL